MFWWFTLCLQILAMTLYSCGAIIFQHQPRDSIVKLGRFVSLPCKATSSLQNSVLVTTWKHNGSFINDYNNKHFKLLHDGTFAISYFLARDVGRYQCTIIALINNVEMERKDSQTATLMFASIGRSFVYSTRLVFETIGTNVHLQCVSPDSYPTATITWLKNGLDVSNCLNATFINKATTTSTLQLANLSFSDAGHYQCVAHNSVLMESIKSNDILVKIKAKQRSPYFVKEPNTVIATRHRPAQVHCFIMGMPEPEISWYKNNVILVNTTNRNSLWNGSLSFTKIELEDNGTYFCKGVNQYGFVLSSPILLEVAYTDYDFLVNPSSKTVNVNRTLLLDCVPPKSFPVKTKITWSKELTDITFNNNVIMLHNASLLIKRVDFSDNGVYHCEAANEVTGEVRTSQRAKITVTSPPVVFIWTSGDRIIENKSLEIVCSASGIPKPNVTLLKYETLELKIVSPTGRLFYSVVAMSDQGTYVCEAKNQAGQDTKNVTVNIQTPPKIFAKPQNTSSQVSQTNLLSCSYTGSPAPFVYWKFQNLQNIEKNITANSSHYELLHNGLVINNIGQDDEGIYTCSAVNYIGYKEVKAYLNVQVEPDVTIPQSYLTTNFSNNLNLTCEASGDPIVKITWQKYGQKINNYNNYVFTIYKDGKYYTESILELLSVDISFVGDYNCLGRNEIGFRNGTVHLDVHVRPSVNLSINGIYQLGGVLRIKCTSYGNPSPTVWLLHNNSIVANGKISNVFETEVHNLTSRNSGAYKCVGKSILGFGNMEKNITVKVLPDPPTIQRVLAMSSTALKISWTSPFDGYSPLEFYLIEQLKNDTDWILITKNISKNQFYFVVGNLSSFVYYNFRMRSKNAVGYSYHGNIAGEQTWPSTPSSPLHIVPTSATAQTISLQWFQPHFRNGIIKMYQLAYSLQEINVSTIVDIDVQEILPNINFTLKDLQPFKRYTIQVRAATYHDGQYLWGPYSLRIAAWTKEATPTIIVQNVNVSHVTSTSLQINFTKPTNEINGRLIGYKIFLTTFDNVSSKIVDTNETSYIVKDLEAYTKYQVSVAVMNNVGVGPRTPHVTIQTKPIAPGRVKELQVFFKNNTVVLLSWQPPSGKHPITLYFNVTITSKNSSIIASFITNQTSLFLDNLSFNSTYTAQVHAGNHLGLSEVHASVNFSTAWNIITTVSPTRIQPPALVRSWLDREYLIVIIAVSALAILLLTVLFVILSRKCFAKKIKYKCSENDWEVNPHYDNNYDGVSVERSKFSDVPTLRMHDFREDFIWSEDETNSITTTSSHVYDAVDSPKYTSVEPYQGHRLSLSPLVKLKGVAKKKTRAPITNIDSNLERIQPSAKKDFPFTTLPIHSNKRNMTDMFENLADCQLADYDFVF